MHVRTGDLVEVMCGADRGKRGKILSVNLEAQRVVVQGVRLIYKHIRRSQQNPQGGRIQKEGTLHVSNVMLVCEKCNKHTRIQNKTLKDGKRVRACRKCQETVGAYGNVIV
ncbi:MAG: 50S ribosomal protein L24 [Planctomycetota bacterium]